ncbi:hypothetical protein [Haloactinomyces albus]|uniref:Uncharacterized protein n=1 Tax=Haloactinomyces albus TaxID=1352928 RepID=A0AAE3ZD87_9ACTN|nr:hypothetical protein [Haloactinomyces albus]MDR7302766.1 hypothetical protein [Haloactinomyces albus]
MIRPGALYLRSRQVQWSLPAAVAGIALLSLPIGDPGAPGRATVLAVLALALGFGVLGQGLGSPDVALESTGAIPWARWRLAHVVAIAGAVLATVLVFFALPTGLAARDAIGLAGLTALGATLFGGQLAWLLPVGWAGASAVVPPLSEPDLLAVLTWPMQPADSLPAALTAATLACGVIAYAIKGSRSSTSDKNSGFRGVS